MNFDDIINATTNNGPSIISRQDDSSQVKIETDAIRGMVASQSGGVPVWDAYEYGMTREQAQAILDAAETPEARAKAEKTLREIAMRRASIATSDGGRLMVAYTGEVAWHELGTRVDGVMTGKQALELSGMNDMDIRKLEQLIDFNGQLIKTGAFAVVRIKPNGEVVNFTQGKAVGKDYKIVTCEQSLELLDTLGDQIRYESIGALGNGETFFACTDVPAARFEAIPGDEIEGKIVLTSTHDGSGSLKVFPSTMRAICANTHTTMMRDFHKNKALGRCLTFRHTSNVAKRIEAAKLTMQRTTGAINHYATQARHLATKSLNPIPYIENVLDVAVDRTIADVQVTQSSIGSGEVLKAIVGIQDSDEQLKAERAYKSTVKKRGELLTDIMERYESERCAGGTAWSAYNAVTESVDHGSNKSGILAHKGDERTRKESRFESTLNGRGADIKEYALQLAVEQTA